MVDSLLLQFRWIPFPDEYVKVLDPRYLHEVRDLAMCCPAYLLGDYRATSAR